MKSPKSTLKFPLSSSFRNALMSDVVDDFRISNNGRNSLSTSGNGISSTFYGRIPFRSGACTDIVRVAEEEAGEAFDLVDS